MRLCRFFGNGRGHHIDGRIVSPGSSGQAPPGLLGALLLVAAAEHFVARHKSDRFLNPTCWNWRQTAELAGSGEASAAVVCFGDSLIQCGVAPTVVARQTGHRALTVALGGGSVAGSFVLFRRMLESGRRPDAVVLEAFPKLLADDLIAHPSHWAAVAGLRDGLDLSWQCRAASFFGRFVVARLFPSYRLRHEVRANLTEALDGRYDPRRHDLPPSLRDSVLQNRGAMLVPARSDDRPDLDAWAGHYFPPDWTCHPANERYLRRFLALAESRQVPVFWVLPPYRPGLQARCERSGFDARHRRFVASIQADYRHTTVIDARRANYDPSVFADPHHLGRPGAEAFSLDLAATLLRALDGGRLPAWIELKPHRDGLPPWTRGGEKPGAETRH